jgi:hypothetical protein
LLWLVIYKNKSSNQSRIHVLLVTLPLRTCQ